MQQSRRQVYFWETAPFFRLLLGLIIGILFYNYTSEREPLLFIAIGGMAILLFIVTSFIKTNSGFAVGIRFISLFTSLFSIGWVLCYFGDNRNDPTWYGNQLGAKNYLVRVTSTKGGNITTRLGVTLLYAIDSETAKPVTGKAFVNVFKDSANREFSLGDSLLIPGNWETIKNAGNPGAFDYATYCTNNNYYHRQFVYQNKIFLYHRGNFQDLPWITRAHHWCMGQLHLYLRDSTAMGLIQSMLLGDETNLDKDLLHAYSETGIVHIIAISGGNVAIFFLLISYLLWWVKNKKHHWIKYIVALPLVWFYVIMAGAPPSAVRAAMMFSILAIGFSLQKPDNSLNFLFAAAFILLCAEPMWLFSVGFQLSFIATLSLLVFYNPIYKLYTPTNKIVKAIWNVIVASLAAEILVAPVVVYYFHLFPVMFLIANVLAYLFMSGVLALGIGIVLCSIVPVVAQTMGYVTIFIVTVFDKIVYWLRSFNPTAFHYLNIKNYELLLIYFIIGGVAVFLLQKKKSGLFIGISATCLLVASFCKNEWDVLHQEKLMVYNVHGGSCIELIKGKYYHTIFVAPDTEVVQYVTIPAHINMNAWRKGNTFTNSLYRVNNCTVLVADSLTERRSGFPVDYIIITDPVQDPLHIIKLYSPKEVILSSPMKKQAEKWQEMTAIAHIKLHKVSTDGAFVLE